jgi:hypothetical protein
VQCRGEKEKRGKGAVPAPVILSKHCEKIETGSPLCGAGVSNHSVEGWLQTEGGPRPTLRVWDDVVVWAFRPHVKARRLNHGVDYPVAGWVGGIPNSEFLIPNSSVLACSSAPFPLFPFSFLGEGRKRSNV